MTAADLRADRWHAPLTPAQAVALNEHQRGPAHLHTCDLDPSHPPLAAYRGGLYCTACEYTQLWAHPVEVTARHHLIAAELVTHTSYDPDNGSFVVVHSPEEAADRALAALADAGYRLIPPGEVREESGATWPAAEALRPYVGEWVVVKGAEVAYHGPTAMDVVGQLRAAGDTGDALFFVPVDPHRPFAGSVRP